MIWTANKGKFYRVRYALSPELHLLLDIVTLKFYRVRYALSPELV